MDVGCPDHQTDDAIALTEQIQLAGAIGGEAVGEPALLPIPSGSPVIGICTKSARSSASCAVVEAAGIFDR